MKKKIDRTLKFDEQHLRCSEFIKSFEDYDMATDQTYGKRKYLIQLQQIANRQRKTLEVSLEDLQLYFNKEDEVDMVRGFRDNVKRYVRMFTQISADFMPKRNKILNDDDEIKEKFDHILENHRRENLNNQTNEVPHPKERVPISAHQNYDVVIVYGPHAKYSIRTITDLKAEDMGSLVILKGIVVRANTVKPQITVATYGCDVCGSENYQEIHDSTYKPLTQCMSKKCIENKVSGKLTFLVGHSKFRCFQEIKIQETSDQIKQGSIPKSITVHLKGNNVKQASPGDIILLQGVMLPTRRYGFRNGNLLAFGAHIQAHKVLREKKKYVEMALSPQMIDKVHYERNTTLDNRIFDKLARSIAPQIYGMENVKKALVLLMAGGVTKQTHDGVKIRGELNVALIGDPGIAKSQLLKHISHLAPRAIYTSGKGSSGVGLTAAIVVDPISKEAYLEAGALVLADMGICCIDEFDKMEEYDRTAIHEVMEQQTVSIAKAGITTTLNARTSVLAAANPMYGRYNKSETPHKNINLPAALLSRFDMIFILLDEAQKKKDYDLALHIAKVHQNKKSPITDVYDAQFIRTYIALAKEFKPRIQQEFHKVLINRYVEKRKEQCDASKEGESYTTTRSLLALIRLCQARAKLRFSSEVSPEDIQECIQLLEASQKNIIPERKSMKPKMDYMSAIFELIKDRCSYNEGKVEFLSEIESRATSRGYNLQELKSTLKNYEKMGVIMIEDDDKVRLI